MTTKELLRYGKKLSGQSVREIVEDNANITKGNLDDMLFTSKGNLIENYITILWYFGFKLYTKKKNENEELEVTKDNAVDLLEVAMNKMNLSKTEIAKILGFKHSASITSMLTTYRNNSKYTKVFMRNMTNLGYEFFAINIKTNDRYEITYE